MFQMLRDTEIEANITREDLERINNNLRDN